MVWVISSSEGNVKENNDKIRKLSTFDKYFLICYLLNKNEILPVLYHGRYNRLSTKMPL